MIQTILHLSDTRGLHRQLKALPEADAIVHSGDFTLDGTENEAYDFIAWFMELPYPHKLFIAGNHDNCLYQAHLEGLSSDTHYLCHSGIEIEGVRFYGLPMFVEDEKSGLSENYIRQIPLNTDILITHQPPLGICDYAVKIQWGNYSLLKRVSQINPKLHLFGHIHEANSVETVGHTVYANSALVNNAYELVYKPRLLTLTKNQASRKLHTDNPSS